MPRLVRTRGSVPSDCRSEMSSYEVELPRDVEPRYPDHCVRCCKAKPESRVRLYTHAIGWWSALMKFGPSVSAEFPVCRACKPRVLAQAIGRVVRNVLVIGGALTHYLVVLYFVMPLTAA